MTYKRIPRTQEHQERLQNERDCEKVLKTEEYEARIFLAGEYRRKEIVVSCNEKNYIPSEYSISIKTSQGFLFFEDINDFQDFEIFDFIIMSKMYALLKLKKKGDEEVQYFATYNTFSKLSLFSFGILIGYETRYMLSLIRAMDKQNDIFISLTVSEAMDVRNPICRITRIIADGIRIEDSRIKEKKGEDLV
ncbi:MAG: hypothetical protein IJN64_17655 [Lachnospiraceae bacterium]|nr:hypothetical protein [Lachnospiraceae bacterium]